MAWKEQEHCNRLFHHIHEISMQKQLMWCEESTIIVFLNLYVNLFVCSIMIMIRA